MNLFGLGKTEYFEDWCASFTKTGLNKVLNPKSLIRDLGKKRNFLVVDYLNRSVNKEGKPLSANSKSQVLRTILVYPDFIQSIPDKQAFAEALNAQGILSFGRALNDKDLASQFVRSLDKEAPAFFRGIGANIIFFFDGLDGAAQAMGQALTKKGYEFEFIGAAVRPYAKEWGAAMTKTSLPFLHPPNTLFLDILHFLDSLEEDVEHFAEGIGSNIQYVSDGILLHYQYWVPTSRLNKIFLPLFRGLGPHIEQFVDGLTQKTILERSYLFSNVPSQFARYVAKSLTKSPERANAFGRGISGYTGKSKIPIIDKDFASFILLLGKVSDAFLKGYFENNRSADWLLTALGNRVHECLANIPLSTKQLFISLISTEKITLDILKAISCPYCHQQFKSGDAVLRCLACSTVIHNDCAAENHNHCPTLACNGSLIAILGKKQNNRAQPHKFNTNSLKML